MAYKSKKKKPPVVKETRSLFVRLRATPSEKAKIEQAAAALDLDQSEYMRQVLLGDAERIMAREYQTVLSEEAWDAFARELEAPAKTIPALAEFLRRKPIWERT